MRHNAAADDVTLTDDMLRRVDEIVPRGAFAGERFQPHLLALLEED
jgi:hypothetical protein